MTTTPTTETHRAWTARDRAARTLLILAALGAALSAASAVGTLQGAPEATQVVEAWRMLGFVVFAGLFGLLAWRPRAYPGVWELTILHKAGIAVLAASFAGATDATSVVWIDGVLALVLVAAYLLAEGYRAWRA